MTCALTKWPRKRSFINNRQEIKYSTNLVVGAVGAAKTLDVCWRRRGQQDGGDAVCFFFCGRLFVREAG